MIGRPCGRVIAARSVVVEASLSAVQLGDGARIATAGGDLGARVVALDRDGVVLAPFAGLGGAAVGDPVTIDPDVLALPLGTILLGRAVDAGCAPVDGGCVPRGRPVPADVGAWVPRDRRPCVAPLQTGIRVLDGPLAFGRGARVGLFGGPGAGKSTLLDAIVRGTAADAVVIALIGERGREAERRIAALDERSTIVIAGAERPAAERLRAAEVAFVQAAFLRSRGLDVLLVVDSLARVAAAARECALAIGEPVGRGGYPPSTFAFLARLLETAGATAEGSVTAVVTVLSEGPDEHDAVSEAARSLLDGHIVLSDALAQAGRFPAVDLPRSASRTLDAVVPASHRRDAALLRAAVAALDASRDARALGLDAAAGDPFLARAVALEPEIEAFLRQDVAAADPGHTVDELCRLADILDDGRPR